MALVFLSHSSCDKELARRLAIDLRMSRIRVWFDEWEIHVGHSISQRIGKGLDEADFVVVLLTKQSIASGWVQKEWMSRIGDEAISQGIFVLPVLAEDCVIPRLLQDKRYADFRSDYELGLRDLISSIQLHAANELTISGGATIESGRIVYEDVIPDIPMMRGLINTIESGFFERHKYGLKAHVQFISSHQALQDFADTWSANRVTLESTDYSISCDPGKPSEFVATRSIKLPAGSLLPDISTGKQLRLPLSIDMDVATRVVGRFTNGTVVGKFYQTTLLRSAIPLPIPDINVSGSFKAIVSV